MIAYWPRLPVVTTGTGERLAQSAMVKQRDEHGRLQVVKLKAI